MAPLEGKLAGQAMGQGAKATGPQGHGGPDKESEMGAEPEFGRGGGHKSRPRVWGAGASLVVGLSPTAREMSGCLRPAQLSPGGCALLFRLAAAVTPVVPIARQLVALPFLFPALACSRITTSLENHWGRAWTRRGR
ncbi:uncharacterized protein N7482_007645 [Penicillium canariense]|uniref:Uncharacterized protein n=1 Tax=Penicillium canariense TaxID=189055 RepID=A0A9W9HZU6_9EURO|nr:uncharacterized protein N7482_007645 [Penicillium canariense]KAJ5160641.1 hypothetical protein N7482_007645 [Penicillium canariense]